MQAASSSPSPSSSASESSLLRCIAADLSQLLALPLPPFLSHCCLNAELQLLLRSYLHHLRVHRPVAPPHPILAERVFLVLHRLTAALQAEPPELRPQQLPASLCSLPAVIDVAACYALHNTDATAAIVTRLLSSSPSLSLQLPALAETVTASLSSLLSQLSLPAPLAFLSSSTAFLSDSYTALYSLLLCRASFASVLQAAGWTTVSVRLYGRLCQLLRDGRGDADALRQLRRLVMSALHCLLSTLYLQPLTQEEGDVAATAAGLLETLSDAAASPPFLPHYAQLHRLPAVLHKLTALRAVSSALGPQRISALLALLPAAPLPSPVPAPTPSLLRASSSQQREEQQVEELRALFDGELSADFARACLREYNSELSAAVQAVFDDALPDRLQRVERSKRRDWAEGGAEAEAAEAGDMLGDERSDDEDAFRAYLLRTGRVGREEQQALTRSSRSVFEDRSDVDVLRQRIIASSAQDLYDDEADDDDDDYAQLLSFRPDETPLDVESGDRPDRSRAPARGAPASTGNERDRWRREEAERETRREADSLKRIEAIAPSRRSEEEKAEWQRLTAASQPLQQQRGTEQPGRGGSGMRGRSASRGRGGAGSDAPVADDGSSGGTSAPAAVGTGTRGRGRGRGGQAAGMSSEEREQQRAQRHEQSAVDKQKARQRMLDSGSDDEQDEDGAAAAGGKGADDAAAVQRAGPTGAGGGDDGQLSAEAWRGRGAGGRGRGRGGGQRGSRGQDNHNRKALAFKKLNTQ